MPELENPPQADWGREPLVLPGGKDCPELPRSGTGLLHKGSQQERQQDQVWDGRSDRSALSTGSELMTFVASTGQVDRNGNILDVAGWELDHYRANPVILFNHNWDLPPVGKTLQVGTEGDRLMVTIQFAPTVLGRELAILNANRYMGAASVGVRMLEWEIRRHPEHGYPIGFHSHRHELLEISVVPVPANPDTLLAAAQSRLCRDPDRVGADLGPCAAHLACPESFPYGKDRRVGLPSHPWEVVGPPRPGPDPSLMGRVEGFEIAAPQLLRAIYFGLRGD